MALNISNLRSLAIRYRTHAQAILLCLIAIAMSWTLGSVAKRRATPLKVEHGRLQAAQEEVSNFRAAFRPSTAEEDSVRLPDSLAVAIDREARLTLAQVLAQKAELAGLRDVRVRFAEAAPDAEAPAVPQLASRTPQVAQYTVALDGAGTFSNALSVIRQLPPSVTLQHFSAARGADGVIRYHLSLAVFESSGGAPHA